jgi:hypothetical protein
MRRRTRHRRARTWVPPARRRRRLAAVAASTAPVLDVTGQASGLYRVASSDLAAYELYVGVDGAAIDFDAPPLAMTATLPFTTDPLAPDHRYEFVLRRRNKYDLVSLNVASEVLELDAGGDVVPTPPSAPTEVSVDAAAAGTVLVTARYAYAADGDDAADAFLVYLRSNGTDPDPGVDTPAEVAMRRSGGVARLRYTSSAFAEGATVKVIVRTRRSGTPDVDSTNVDVHTATATLLGPAAPPSGGAFLTDVAEQVQ